MSQFDSAGMRYRFEIDTQGLSELRAAREELQATKEAFSSFSRELTARASAAGTVADRLRALRIEARLAAISTAEETAESRKNIVVLNQRAQAIEAYNKQFDKKFRLDQAAAVASERNFVAERRLASEELNLSRAHESVTKVLDKRAQIETRRAVIQERQVALTDREAKSLGILTDEQLRLVAAKERLAAIKQSATDPELASLQAQSRALSSIVEARTRVAALRQDISDPTLISLRSQGDALQRIIAARSKLADLQRRFTEADPELTSLRQQSASLSRILAARERVAVLQQQTSDPELIALRGEAAAMAKILAARERLASLQQQATDPELSTLKAQAAAITQITTARERLLNLQQQARDPELQRIRAETSAIRDELKATQDLANAQRLSGSNRLRDMQVEAEALRRQIRSEQEEATQRLLASRGLDEQGKRAERPQDPGIKQRILDFIGLGKAAGDAEGNVNRISFSFRRLIGIFAAFTIVRQVIQGFRDLIREAVEFNARTESVQVGIAGLIAATADIRNAQGQQVKGAQAFAIAQGEARRQTQLLLKDALLTATTFTDLAEAFQTAVGPGLRAGLGLDQIRVFTREISIAASSLGLAQNQLAEEVRSILSGNITRNTRIAQVLSIGNADIQRAKDAGQLFEFLQSKLSVFLDTAETSANTLPGLFVRLKGAIQVIAGAGIKPFTDDIKKALKEIIDLLVQVDRNTGSITVNPEVVATIQALTGFLRTAAEEAKRFFTELGSEKVRKLAETISDLLSLVIRTVAELLRGIEAGINLISSIIDIVRTAVQSIVPQSVLNTLTTFLRFVTREVGLILGLVIGVLTVSKLISVTWKGLSIGLLPLKFLWDEIIKKIILAKTAAQGVSLAAGLVGGAGAGVAKTATRAAGVEVAEVAGGAAVGGAAPGLLSRLFQSATGAAGTTVVKVTAITAALAAATLAAKRLVDQAEVVNERFPNESALFRFKEAFKLAFIGSGEGVARVIETSKTAAEKAMEAINASISGVSEAMESLRQEFKKFEDEARQAHDEALASVSAVGLGGAVAQINQQAAAGRLRAARELREVERELLDLQKQQAIVQVELEQKRNQFRIDTALRNAGQAVREGSLPGLIDSLATLRQIEPLLAHNAALREKINEALKFEEEVERKIAAITAPHVTQIAEAASFELERSNQLKVIEATFARSIRLAEQQGNITKAEALHAQQAAAEAQVTAALADKQRKLELADLQKQIDLTKQIRGTFPAEGDRTPKENQAVKAIDEEIAALERLQAAKQNEAVIAETIETEEAARKNRDAALTEARLTDPITAGIVEAFTRANEEVRNLFQQTVNIMTNAIQGFSQFGAQAIVSIFDPTSQFDVVAAFGQLLQSIAQQIIQMLIQLAITEIVLNAATSGLLGATFGQIGTLRGGRFEGGPVGLHEGGRIARDHHRRARGFHSGGHPSGFHGAVRPSGLHPRDTEAIWADPREWVIRAQSVAKAGDDALQRINQGDFNPYALRGALGLSGGPQSKAVTMVTAGLAAGGGVGRMSAVPAPSQAKPQGPSIAVMFPSEEAGDRALRGGEQSMLRLLAENHIYPRTR
jgi:hypothetical protein